MRHALIVGATGLVGSELLKLLVEDAFFDRISVLGRRRAPVDSPRITQHVTTDWSATDLGGAITHVFCALGTTIKVAGSQEAFRRVDHDMPVTAGRIGLESGATHYLLVSALGANAKSRVFYSRVKGETENDILALGYPSVTIARPSLLLGPRSEHRRGEELAKKFAWLIPGKYKPVDARTVAAALLQAAKENTEGLRVLEFGA